MPPFLPSLLLSLAVTVTVTSSSCPRNLLAVYRLHLETYWGEDRFPKQYPQWRPPAHWSKTVGFTHPAQFVLWEVGEVVGDGIRKFVETGDSDALEREARDWAFLDSVLAPPILQGVGHSDTILFLDGNHSQVSVITKVVPSPDWFVGISGLDLCRDGRFLESHTEEALPMDAGTDNGFTFTSPNWETEPRGDVFSITNRFPAHPAGSFHYPDMDRLPRLAVFTIKKLREYTLTENAELGEEEEETVKYKYDVEKHNDDKQPAHVVEFVPVESAAKISEGDTVKGRRKQSVQKVTERKTGGNHAAEVAEIETEINDVISARLDFDVAGSDSANVGVDFIPVDLVRALSTDPNNTNKLSDILSNEIPGHDLIPRNNMLSNSTSRSLTFLPVTVTTKTRIRNNLRNKSKKTPEIISKENELMRLLIAVENMTVAETRKTIIKKNQEKRRNRKKMEHRRREEKRRREGRRLEKENSPLPPDGFHASNSKHNFLKKKYYSSEPKILVPDVLEDQKKNSLYAQILASYQGQDAGRKPRGRLERRKLRRKRRRRRSTNCKVSEWGDWGDCNKSCGIGESVRRRQVIQHPAHGGMPCPVLMDYKWCGSARNCNSGYFHW